MKITSRQILRTYVTLMLLSTLASSFIWGVNTLFLLDAGLSITAAFAANAFFTAGQVLFEVPTGVVADMYGRRTSYLLGTFTLFATTLMYLGLWHIEAPFWMWAVVSALLGLGFTFFSGATEAWLVDALKATNYKDSLDHAFAKGQIASGVAMLTGTLGGGIIAQFTNLGVPYVLRALVLAATTAVAFVLMKDVGFTPQKGKTPLKEVKRVLRESYKHGLKNRPVRWMILAGPFGYGVSFYAFYAMQPYLLELYGRTESYAIAGIAAAIVGGAQVGGGFLAPFARRFFRLRTAMLAFSAIAGGLSLVLIGAVTNFWFVLFMLVVWAILFALSFPIRQAYLNGLIPSNQRATVLSSDNLIGSTGGVVFQPALGKVADIWSYPASYVASGLVQILALPFLILARRENAASDYIKKDTAKPPKPPTPTEPPAEPIPGRD